MICSVPKSGIPVTFTGVYCTLAVQLVPNGRVDPQLLVCNKKSGLVRRAFAGNANAVSPVLIRVMLSGALVELTVWFPKLRTPGVMRIWGPVAPVPASVTICCVPNGSLSEIVSVPEK